MSGIIKQKKLYLLQNIQNKIINQSMKIVIIANRLPLKIIEENNEYKVIPSPGGLTTGLDSLSTNLDKYWVGWPGMYLESCQEKDNIDKQLKEHNFYPVYLSPEQIENYYEGYSNSVLWPLCHYFPSYIRHKKKYWETYQKVNALFCQAALSIIEPGDIVWIQDYHLMLLPKQIRDKVQDINIGYFHHIPFPSYELFRTLPERTEVLEGLLGADLIGFHTHSYMRHFISAIYRVLKLDCHLDEIHLQKRIVNVDAFPMGINYELYHDAILNPAIMSEAEEVKKKNFNTGKLILSVDRLDYSKGILLRLKSFKSFLENNPAYRGKVSLLMIVAPSRDNVKMYANLKDKIDKAVGNINGKYSTVNWRPVYYFYRNFSFEQLTPLYYISDIALVTPFRDGMNLVAKEYLATKRNNPGVLILSEMAGAAAELSDAIIVNPTDAKEIEDAILQALEMPLDKQMKSLAAMQEIISNQTVRHWAENFIEELKAVKNKNNILQEKIIEKNNFEFIKNAYNKACKRLILLDYDGTLVPFYHDPETAVPSADVINLLKRLSNDPKNKIVINSGRNKNSLDNWFGYLPISLSAEHGAFYKENGKWHQVLQNIDWDDKIISILKYITKRTPHSKIEIKDTALVWHYRNVDSWLANLRVNQLVDALMHACFRNNLQIMKGNKIVEFKPLNISKGTEAKRLISADNYDFIMAIGDDTTDEEMFMALPSDAITIKVGQNSTLAKYNIPTQSGVLAFFNKLIKTE